MCKTLFEQPFDSPIINFYQQKNILITGVTGFIGKVLLEKLLRSIKDVGTIYVLLRSKQGCSSSNRLHSMLYNKPFSFHLNNDKQCFEKVQAIDGDITIPDLGLSPEDRELLINNVDIVFHLAASVKFNAPLRENIDINVNGTIRLIELIKQMTNLQCFVHVSTAYANSHLDKIEEELVPLSCPPEHVMKMFEWMDDATIDQITPKLLEGRPNTYTYSKSLAEHIVYNEFNGLAKVCIARPSIVAPAKKEPVHGWIDNYNGPAGLGLLGALGILRVFEWQGEALVDIVPVDMITNGLIAIAWHTATDLSNECKVINLTSSQEAPITWYQLFEFCRSKAIEAPPKRLIRPIIETPPASNPNPIMFNLTKFFSHLLFAYLIDLILVLMGYKTIMVKITKRMHQAFDMLKPFATRQWIFESKRLAKIMTQMNDCERELFDFNFSAIDWHVVCADSYMGCRRYLLKDDDSTVPESIKKMRMVKVGYKIFLSILSIVGLFFVWWFISLAF